MKQLEKLKKIKSVNIPLNRRTVYSVTLVLLVAAVAFSYREMSSMRRDLYAVRNDYYGGSPGYAENGEDAENFTPNFDIVSQSVKNIRINDDDATSKQVLTDGIEWQQIYKEAKVREVEVKLTNDTSYGYSFSDSLGYVNDSGVVIRPVVPHPDDNKNPKTSGYYGLELAPGGTTTIYLYFLDDGKEITELYNSDQV